MNYVVDTSVILQWFHMSGELHLKEARQILDDLRSGRINITIPDILPLELTNALIKGKDLPADEVNKSLNDLFDMPIKIIEVSLPVLEESSRLMAQYNITSYDAYFLALAKYEDCKLISDDNKAHGKVKDGTVIMLDQYK